MTLTVTIPMEQKCVHWLSMGATGRNGLWGVFQKGVFLGTASNYGVGGFVNSAVKLSVNIANPCSKLLCTEVREVYQIFRKQTLYV